MHISGTSRLVRLFRLGWVESCGRGKGKVRPGRRPSGGHRHPSSLSNLKRNGARKEEPNASQQLRSPNIRRLIETTTGAPKRYPNLPYTTSLHRIHLSNHVCGQSKFRRLCVSGMHEFPRTAFGVSEMHANGHAADLLLQPAVLQG